MNINRGAIAILFIGLWSAAVGTAGGKDPSPSPSSPAKPSAPLPNVPVDWPSPAGPTNTRTTSTFASSAAPTASTLFKQSLNMKLLVISADGTEPSFTAITFFLDRIGIPYDAVVLTQTNLTLPTLNDSNNGFYQGIVLASGSLAYNTGTGWASALSATGWASLDAYQRTYGVRLVSYYTFPEPRYGMALAGTTGYSNTSAKPALLSLTSTGKTLFPYLIATNKLEVANAYYYPATAVAAAGETTTPIMTISSTGVNNLIVGVTHVAADGRESLAMTFDSSPYLMHSMALNYGIFNWVSKGVFIGQRKIYITPQSDDFFLANDMYANTPAACQPSSLSVDPTYDPSVSCPTARDSSGDLSALVAWQQSWQAKSQFKGVRLSHAFNGFGTTTDGGATKNDPLISATKAYMNQFYWLNHTWDHENLDCYDAVPNSHICKPATYAESLAELQQNIALAKSMGLPNDSTSMVTPNISGLTNLEFLRAAKDSGIKYLVSDMSYSIWLPSKPNTGVRNPGALSILFIPRRATNIFYNTKSGNKGATGSLVDEYNYFFGPNGMLRIGGPGGAPFFTTDQTYAQIIDKESDALLSYMLNYEWYPSMFHQSNLIRYSGQKSLYSDVMDATMSKFAAMSNLPVSSLPQTTLGRMMEERMAFNDAGVTALYLPGQGIKLSSAGAANAPITGVCAAGCVSYGGQNISSVPVSPAGTMIPLY
jgi:hypothetical protein